MLIVQGGKGETERRAKRRAREPDEDYLANELPHYLGCIQAAAEYSADEPDWQDNCLFSDLSEVLNRAAEGLSHRTHSLARNLAPGVEIVDWGPDHKADDGEYEQ
jgi:hypothetical protein